MPQHDFSHPDPPEVPPTRDERWEPCPEGQLSDMVDQLAQRRRAGQHRQWAARLLVAMVFLLMLGGGVWWSVSDSPDAAGMTCSDVVPLLVKYEHRLLAPQQQAQVSEHLEKCPHCREKYRQLRQRDESGHVESA